MGNANGFFKRIQLCLTQRGYGKTVVVESLGTAIKYFLLFMLIIGSITMVPISYDIITGLKETTQIIQQEVPEFRFENGYLECEREMPLIKEEGNSIFVIDTTGRFNEEILNSYESGIFISSTHLIQKSNSIEYRTVSFKDLDWLNFSKEDMIKFVDKWSAPASIFVFVFGLIIILAGKFINVVFVSMLGLIVNAIMKTRLLYENLFKLSVYAITLPTVVSMVAGLLKLTIPYFFWLYHMLTIYYLYRYLSEFKKKLDLPSTTDTAKAALQDIE